MFLSFEIDKNWWGQRLTGVTRGRQFSAAGAISSVRRDTPNEMQIARLCPTVGIPQTKLVFVCAACWMLVVRPRWQRLLCRLGTVSLHCNTLHPCPAVIIESDFW